MAFDGTHELGVTDVIEYKGNADGTKTLTVKYYSENDLDMGTAPTLSTDAGFIKISKPVITEAGDGSTTSGKIATYTVTFIDDGEKGALSDIIKVNWCGLSRQTKIVWDRPFDGASMCSTTLTIHPTDGTGDKTISDYWDFLNTKVFGIKPEKWGDWCATKDFISP